MPTSEELTDSYLAALLAKEAKDSGSTPQSATSRPRNAPKPNLRFLRNIIRESDNHNAVLLERDRHLAGRDQRSHRSLRDTSNHDDARPSKKRRTERPDRWSSVLARQGLRHTKDDKAPSRDAADNEERDPANRAGHSKEHRRHEQTDYNRERHQSDQTRHREKRRERYRLSRSRSRSRSRSPARPSRHPSSSRHRDRSRDKLKRHLRSALPPVVEQTEKASSRAPTDASATRTGQHIHESDSDPLEAIVGPRLPPKVKPRGRGATAASSGIEARFADADYNPANDRGNDLDEEDDDWNMALSALQDRVKWRAIGADRLRAAGFDEADIAKWESSSSLASVKREEDIDSVIWRKRGEAREWDRGKVVQPDGATAIKAPWSQ